jgi:hypothetical protein
MKIQLTVASLLIIAFLTSCGGGSGGRGVYGKITDASTGEPISFALVELDCTNCTKDFTARTDKDGNYSFPDAVASDYMLTITWGRAPACTGYTATKTVGQISNESGVFFLAYSYSPTDALSHTIVAVTPLRVEEGQGKEVSLAIACP